MRALALGHSTGAGYHESAVKHLLTQAAQSLSPVVPRAQAVPKWQQLDPMDTRLVLVDLSGQP